MKKVDSIPVIDVGALDPGGEAELDDLAREFYRVYSTVGFSYIVNHGVSDELIQRVFAASARFHGLPIEEKLKVELDCNHRGYIPINTSTDVNSKLAEVNHPNQSASFMVMREDDPDAAVVKAGCYLAGRNQWPELLSFREEVMAYNNAMSALAQKLVRVVFRALGADTQVMNAFDTPTTWLRLLHYPSIGAQRDNSVEDLASEGVYGSAPHTDFGCLTLLAQDEVGGLQVQAPAKEGEAGDWIDVPRIPGSFVVNVGDMLHRWSNGLLRSTPHRVINVSGKARYSCPFFFDPSVATNIAPLDCCIEDGHEALFSSINFGEFLRSELEAGYDHHKEKN